MDIHSIQHQKIDCSLYWGEGRLMEEHVPARLSWQPLQEVPASLWVDPDLFNHAMWANYRPDAQQPLILRVSRKNFIQTLWINEYDVKAYIRGWKNAPVFRLKRIQYSRPSISKEQKISYCNVAAWFMMPGGITTANSDEAKPNHTFVVPVVEKKIHLIGQWLDEDLGDCRIQLYDAMLNDTAVTLVKISECKPLQPELPSQFSHAFKMTYDIISDLLALLLRQNLRPVWQLISRTDQSKYTWIEGVYYDEGAPRRNNFSGDRLPALDYAISALYDQIHRRSHYSSMAVMNDIDAFKDVLATHDVLPRFKKASQLLNQLIGWRGSDISTWPERLKETLDDLNISNSERFYRLNASYIHFDRAAPWKNIPPSLHSMKVLVAGNSPRADWFYGKKINQRNDVVIKLLAELIIEKHLR